MIIPVVLSGGSGTRLWPLSRAMYPKQFIRFFGEDSDTMLSATLKRLATADGFEKPLILCNNDHRFLVRTELEDCGLEAEEIILEPVARNTAAPIAVAALAALKKSPSAILAVMPADHVIDDVGGFTRSVHQAAQVAETGKLVLFGVQPTEPHTGYGYIRQGAGIGDEAFEVAEFVEKPDRKTAEKYLASGEYFWNSGIFVLHAATLIEEMKQHAPAVLDAAMTALEAVEHDLGFLRLDAEALAESPNISIDFAVMEKTRAAAMLPLTVKWSDVGSWSSLWEVSKKERDGNVVRGDALLDATTGCYVHSTKSLISMIGVQDLVVVETADALLIADRSRAQDVSGVVHQLRESGRTEFAQHVRKHASVGILRNPLGRRRLSGEETACEPGRYAVASKAPAPFGTLGGGRRESDGHHRRDGNAARQGRERPDQSRTMAPIGKSR